MKNKIIVMLLTFIVMVFATPVVFEKLMNSKFNTMLLNLQQQKGIVIKEIKDKSSYLTTDKVYEVTIPGDVLEQKEIKFIKLLTEVKFKNLPATNVVFHNVLTKLVLKNNQEVKFLENNFIFDVITPDFKHYKYSVKNKDVKYFDFIISWKGFKGIYIYPKEFKNEDGMLSFYVEKDNVKILLNHIMFHSLKVNNKIEQNIKIASIEADNPNFKAIINGINSDNITIFNKDSIDSKSTLKIKDANVNQMFKLKNLNLSVNLKGLDKNAIELLKQGNDKNAQKALEELLNRGFSGNIKLKIDNLFIMQPLGYLNADVNFNVEKGNNVEKLNNNDFSFINLDAKIEASPQIAALIAMSEPKIGAMIKNENNKSVIVIKIDKGKIYINGKEIKSY